MTNKFPNLGKTYGYKELAEAQRDMEIAKMGSSYASKQRTVAMVEKINSEQAKRREAGK